MCFIGKEWRIKTNPNAFLLLNLFTDKFTKD